MKKYGKNDYSKISTAYHEAAHSIFAILSLFKIDKVELSGNSLNDQKYEICGLTSFYSPINSVKSTSLKRRFANSEIIVNYSGVIAECLLFMEISGAKKVPAYIKNSGQFDLENSKKIIKKFFNKTPDEIKLFKNKKEKIIKNILKLYWSDLGKIASFLLKREKASYKEIKSLLLRRSENKDFWREKFQCIDLMFRDDTLIADELDLKKIFKTQEKLW